MSHRLRLFSGAMKRDSQIGLSSHTRICCSTLIGEPTHLEISESLSNTCGTSTTTTKAQFCSTLNGCEHRVFAAASWLNDPHQKKNMVRTSCTPCSTPQCRAQTRKRCSNAECKLPCCHDCLKGEMGYRVCKTCVAEQQKQTHKQQEAQERLRRHQDFLRAQEEYKLWASRQQWQ